MANSPANIRLTIPQATDRAVKLQRDGWFDEAEIIYADILKAEPDHFDSTHNLGVIRETADKVVVMHDGAVVEMGPRQAILATPRQPSR